MASQHAQRAAYGVVCTIVGYWVVLCAGLGVYLSLLMSETSLSIILTVCVLRLHHAAPGHAAMSPLTASTSPGQVMTHLDRLLPGHAAMSPLTRRLVLQWMAGVVGASVTSRGAARPRDTTPAHKLTRLSPGGTVLTIRAAPSCNIFNLGSSYLNVTLATVCIMSRRAV